MITSGKRCSNPTDKNSPPEKANPCDIKAGLLLNLDLKLIILRKYR